RTRLHSCPEHREKRRPNEGQTKNEYKDCPKTLARRRPRSSYEARKGIQEYQQQAQTDQNLLISRVSREDLYRTASSRREFHPVPRSARIELACLLHETPAPRR